MSERFFTLRSSDKRYPQFIRGEKFKGMVPVPFNSIPLGKAEDALVTFELVKGHEWYSLDSLRYCFQVSRLSWMSLIFMPTIYLLLLVQKGQELSISFTLMALLSLLFLYLFVFILNDYINHIFYSHKKFNLKRNVYQHPIRFPLSYLKYYSLLFFTGFLVCSWPLWSLNLARGGVIFLAFVLLSSLFYLAKAKFKSNLSSLFAFISCGPLIAMCGEWFFQVKLSFHNWFVFIAFGSLAFWLVTTKHFQHLMLDNRIQTKTLATYLGFDQTKRALQFCSSLFVAISLLYALNNKTEYSLILALAVSAVFVGHIVLTSKVHSTVSSHFSNYARVSSYVHLTVSILVLAYEFLK